jgi:hypothetical protein
MTNGTINLREDIFITVSQEIPRRGKKIITSYFPFMGEDECKRYVKTDAHKDANEIPYAKSSLASAIKQLAGPKADLDKVKFTIFSLN